MINYEQSFHDLKLISSALTYDIYLFFYRPRRTLQYYAILKGLVKGLSFFYASLLLVIAHSFPKLHLVIQLPTSK